MVCLPLLGTQQAHAETTVVDDAEAAFSSAAGVSVPILMYHGLTPDGGCTGCTAGQFASHMDYLATNGFHTITMDHMTSWVLTGEPGLPSKPLVLTFDDNYITIYTVAFPELAAHGFKGTNYAHTYYVGKVTSWDHGDWNECAQMEAAGTIFTESHTVMHNQLAPMTQAQMDPELVNSKAAIEANMPNKVCRHLAYPYGSYNATVIARTQAAGYVSGVTTLTGFNTRSTPIYELRRQGINPPNTLASLQSMVSGALGTGAWQAASSLPQFNGSGYRTAAAGTGHAVASWRFTPTNTENYRVSAWWPTGASNATDAPYTVHHASGASTVRVNQSASGGQWVDLGVFPFAAGKSAEITLSDNASGPVVADAVRIESAAVAAVPDWSVYE